MVRMCGTCGTNEWTCGRVDVEVSCSKDLVRLHCGPRTAKMGRKLQWYRDFDKTRDGRPMERSRSRGRKDSRERSPGRRFDTKKVCTWQEDQADDKYGWL